MKFAVLISGLAVLTAAGIFVVRNFRGIGPAIRQPGKNIASIFANRDANITNDANKNANEANKPAVNTTEFPLHVPDGFRIDLVASNLPNARVLQFDAAGKLWISQPQSGQIVRLTLDANGKESDRQVIFSDLDGPHGFVFDQDDVDAIYIAEESQVIKSSISNPSNRTVLMRLPSGGGHSTRTLGLGPDQRLYVTIGSSCNVCRESSDKRASMWVMDRDGSNQKLFASGLRNTVFFTWQGNELWGNDMGRDLLGDNIPPDEVNVITSGKDYGWPFCYGQKIQDKKFDASAAAATRCTQSQPSRVDLQAHSAPLGLAFINDQAWPADWQNDLLIAFHGSWNRSVPTGYEIVRIPLSASGQAEAPQAFGSGWLASGTALGRPVDLKFHGQSLFVSDDKAGVIYRIQPNP